MQQEKREKSSFEDCLHLKLFSLRSEEPSNTSMSGLSELPGYLPLRTGCPLRYFLNLKSVEGSLRQRGPLTNDWWWDPFCPKRRWSFLEKLSGNKLWVNVFRKHSSLTRLCGSDPFFLLSRIKGPLQECSWRHFLVLFVWRSYLLNLSLWVGRIL